MRLSKGGFNIWHFITNSADLSRRIDHSEGGGPLKNHETFAEGDEVYTWATLGDHQGVPAVEQQVLGLHWNFVEDHLSFKVCYIAKFL